MLWKKCLPYQNENINKQTNAFCLMDKNEKANEKKTRKPQYATDEIFISRWLRFVLSLYQSVSAWKRWFSFCCVSMAIAIQFVRRQG